MVQLQTIAESAFDTVRSFKLTNSHTLNAGTEVRWTPDSLETNFKVSPAFSTKVSTATDESSNRVQVSSVANTNFVPRTGLKDAVDGVIIKYDDITVKCNLMIDGQSIQIQLPRALFPEEITYGLPISLAMVSENGVRRPEISLRKLPSGTSIKISKEFDDILACI